MKSEKIKVWIMWGIVAATFIVSLAFYPKLPPQIATHWDAAGKVNGYMSRFWGVMIMPLILVGVTPLLIYLPKIDPTRKNAEGFREYYYDFIIVFLIYMFLVQLYVLLYNIGIKVKVDRFIYISVGFLFYFTGILIEKSKRNWFIGIRTPWTLSSESVWDKTHKLGAALFKLCGVIAVIGAFFGKYAVYFVLFPVIIVSVYLFIYSYEEYKKENETHP